MSVKRHSAAEGPSRVGSSVSSSGPGAKVARISSEVASIPSGRDSGKRSSIGVEGGGMGAGGPSHGRQSYRIAADNKKGDPLGLLIEAPMGYKGRFKEKCRLIADNFRFNILTTVLTVYALFGDDFRLVATYKYLDSMFDVFTVICIVIFVFEVIVGSIGKSDYFGSFFFSLDVLSTATLVFDLTMVSAILFCSTAEDSSSLKNSKAGRAGARAGRTVRIIRLMRLVKLYAKYTAATQEKEKKRAGDKRRQQSSKGSRENMPGGNDDADEDTDAEIAIDGCQSMCSAADFARPSQRAEMEKPTDKKPEQAETRVGKKLGDMTTRRVIILVLVMLFCMPQFSPSSHGLEDFQTSMDIGMEMVYERFRHYCPLNTTGNALPACLQSAMNKSSSPHTATDARNRQLWEDFLLEVLYTHQGNQFAYSLYWLGLQSKSLNAQAGNAATGAVLGDFGYLGQQRYLGDSYLPVKDWNKRYANPDWTTKVPPLSSTNLRKLTTPWVENCENTFWGTSLGVQLSSQKTLCSIEADLRCSEVAYMLPLLKDDTEAGNLNIIFAFNTRSTTTMEAGLNMCQTVFICLCVGIGAMTFSSDADKLLLKPIERMIAKMETIKDNPLDAMRLGDIEFRREEIENAKRKEQLAELNRFQKLWRLLSEKKIKEPMETVILEKTIIKLGGLLALGFGEAGAEIIGHNMGHSAGVDAMLPGNRVEAIIGFCSIHNFLVVNQVLKEKVMIFVNQIGEIVHGCVDDFNGAANKNIGDSFLLIWRISGYEARGQTKLADMAIMSFVRIVTELNKSPVLAQYRKHPGILQRRPHFRVSMGYGLHCGWAIEGAIGSDFKIDASYLSPNVNVAALLDAASADYDVWLLMSHFMMSLCSKELAMMCRLIDHVIVKSARQPLRVFTVDLDYLALQVKVRTGVKYIKNRFKIRQIREIWKGEKWGEDYNVWEAFELDEDIVQMREIYSPEFFRRFATAYRNYETGSWNVARDLLFTCYFSPRSNVGGRPWIPENEWPPDGPTRTLLKYMRQADFKAPADWKGYRYLKPGDNLN